MRLPRKVSCSRADLVRTAAAWGIVAIASFFVVPVSSHAQEAAVEGQLVKQVRVVDESGTPVTEKIPPLPLEAGKIFDFSAEREALRDLYRLGDYSDIRVTAAPESGGLRVDFIVQRNFFNNVIRVEGLKEPPSEPAALASLRLNLGEPFRDSSVREAVDRLAAALHDDGLYQAKISWALTPHEDTRQMDVMVTVDPGLRAMVGDVSIVNETPYPDAQLLRRSKISSKVEMTSERLSHGSDRLRKFLVNQGYLGASAAITVQTYDPQSNRVPLKLVLRRFQVDRGSPSRIAHDAGGVRKLR